MKKTCVQNGYILVTEGARLYTDGTKESFNLAGEQELSDPEAKEQWYTVSWFQYGPFVKQGISACDMSCKREIERQF